MKRLYISILALCTLALAASAQKSSKKSADMKKEITVDRSIQPEERAATRLSIATPQILPFGGQTPTLKATEYTRSSELTSSVPFLEPAPWHDSIPVTPWRGYAGIGYFPLYNLWANAGLKFLDTPNAQANAWVQYDGASYKGRLNPIYKPAFTWNQFNAVANGTYKVDSLGTLSGHVGLLFDARSLPFVYPGDDKQSNTAFGLDFNIGWRSSVEKIAYHALVRADYFGFGKDARARLIDPIQHTIYDLRYGTASEFTPGFTIGAEYSIRGLGRLAVDLKGDYTFANDIKETLTAQDYISSATGVTVSQQFTQKYSNCGVTALHPTLLVNRGAFTAKVGFDAAIVAAGKTSLRLAPDIRIAFEKSSLGAAYLNITGGTQQSTLRRAFGISPYMFQSVHYMPESAPLIAELGINAGPVTGVTASLFFGFNLVDNYLTPAVTYADQSQINTFEQFNLKGFHLGGRIDYTHPTLFSAYFSAEGASRSLRTGYAPWRDKPRYVIGIGGKVSPIDKLDLGIDFELRAKRLSFVRSIANIATDDQGNTAINYKFTPINLHNASNLSLSAAYRYTDRLTFFVRGENLLNHAYLDVFCLPEQRIHGLLGVTYKL